MSSLKKLNLIQINKLQAICGSVEVNVGATQHQPAVMNFIKWVQNIRSIAGV